VDTVPEVGTEVSASQSQQNSSEGNSQGHLKSREKLLDLSSNSNLRSHRNSGRIKRKKKKNYEKRWMKRRGRKGKHQLDASKTKGYTHHLDTYAHQPQLLRSPFKNDMEANMPKLLDPSGREYFVNQRLNAEIPCFPQHSNLSQNHEQKIPNLRLNSTHMRSDANSKDLNNGQNARTRSLPPNCKHHHAALCRTRGHYLLSDCSTPATCQ